MFKNFFGSVSTFGKSIPNRIKAIPGFIKSIPSKAKTAWTFLKVVFTITIPDMIKSVCHSITSLISMPIVAK